MSKSSIVFVCRDCGHESARWQGRCDQCKEWNTLEEFKIAKANNKRANDLPGQTQKARKLSEINISNISRIKTGIDEIDRVFGGGFVPGSIILLSGEPGIGKSTLLLQVMGTLSKTNQVLYWSAEESAEQLASRAERLKLNRENISIISTLDSSLLNSEIEQSIMVVDSIQTVFDPELPASAGSVTQVRSVLQSIQNWAKTQNKVAIVVGHVTKEGEIAGPKTLEHLVDVVAVLEGDPNHDIRLLRSTKNRFGATNEVGVFSMKESGLLPVANPSSYFVNERLKDTPGSAVTIMIEGTRPFLVEVQALTVKTYLTFPRRTASGIDPRRLELIIAILEKRGGIKLYDQDVFVNIVGGIKVTDPAADLAIAMAIISSTMQTAVPQDWCIYGELGLAGEIRSVRAAELRSREIKRLGYQTLPPLRTIDQAIALLAKNRIKLKGPYKKKE